ncbi:MULTISPECIES: hypothetical protein [unclassified Vibrio]|uniref:hypothetical protein n=1 Tax=unclassified Vibrio TaxID=2614977 RepID=UPI001268FC53|nr:MULTISPECIES: hypothetical protein [unclassified Vibrio]QFT40080.1 hypothetical protein FIU99_27190 [Vibrio sp. THAF64]QGM38025.1 hypothetical protein GGC04_27395 [Vibrio sp. THAF191d]QGN73516.1 hypothetical protein GGC03_27385 [Vibrio sp. THAF191c]
MTSTKRYNGVGKRISSNIWVHRTYASEHLTTHELNALELVDFQYDVVRLDLTTRDIALIRCEDFDGQHEPVIVETLNLSSGKRTTSNTNPLIYHHKWLFVTDEYAGFDVAAAKARSERWQLHSPRTRNFTSRIGRLNYWRDWLTSVGLEH